MGYSVASIAAAKCVANEIHSPVSPIHYSNIYVVIYFDETSTEAVVYDNQQVSE